MHETALSQFFGAVSFCSGLVVFAPQFYSNYHAKSVDGLSLEFIVIWLLGDLFNTAGAVLDDLIPAIIFLGCYYTAMDLSLLVQFMLYHRHPRSFSHDSLDSSSSGSLLPSIVHPLSIPVNDIEPRHPKGGRAKSQRRSDSWDNMDEATLPSTLRRELGAARPISRTDSTQSGTRGGQSTLTSLLVIAGASKAVNALSTSYIVRDSVVEITKTHSSIPFIAALFGYISAVLYVGSRVPQIVKNYRSKSCQGLSILMFIFSVTGNLTYTLSIFCQSMNADYLLLNLPWLIGSGGTLAFDFTIFYQFYIYRPVHEQEVVVADDETEPLLPHSDTTVRDV